MQRVTVWTAAGWAAVCLGVAMQPARAAEATLELNLPSAYVWRGITVNDGPVAQPSLDVSLPAGFSLNVWGNLDLSEYHGAFERGEFSEIDLSANYAYQKGRFEFSAGYIEYLFPHQTETAEEAPSAAAPGTRELCAGVEADLGRGFALKLEGFYDLDEVEDFYAYLEGSYGFDLPPKQLTGKLSASAGAAGKDWALYNSGGTDGGLHEYDLALDLTWKRFDPLTVGGKMAYAGSLDEDVLPDQDTHWYGGLSVAYSF